MIASVRDRMATYGAAHIGDADAIAIVLGDQTTDRACALLRAHGGTTGLATVTVPQLRAAGLPPAAAARLVAAFSLVARVSAAAFRPGTAVRAGRDIATMIRDAVRGSGRESFFAVSLDARHRVLAIDLIATGDATSCPVNPAQVLRHAVRCNAVAFVAAHNHPSGDPSPSAEDRQLTDRLRAAGELVGIALLDHVIAGAERFYSFADEAFYPLGAP